jgi:hypothetical protein
MAKSKLAEQRAAAVKALWNRVQPPERDYEITMSRAEVAAAIRELAPLSKAQRWADAVEAWAELVEQDDAGRITWAFNQGGVWFGYGVLGLM